MRRKDDALRGVLLDCARQTAEAQGPDAVTIRAIARRAGIATGTVYNYFADKEEILLALTEEYWKKNLPQMRAAAGAGSFCEQLAGIYGFLRERIDRSAGMLMRSLGGAEAAGRARMSSMQNEMEAALRELMSRDPAVRADVWDESFTPERYARFLMRNLVLYLKEGAPDLDFLIAVVQKTIY